MTRLFTLLFILFALSSCDPGYSVNLINQTDGDRNIKVIVTNEYKIKLMDSILIYEPPFPIVSVKIFKDLKQMSYTFILEKGKTAILQRGIGGPDLTEKIIIENTDTINMKSDKRVKIKKQNVFRYFKGW